MGARTAKMTKRKHMNQMVEEKRKKRIARM